MAVYTDQWYRNGGWELYRAAKNGNEAEIKQLLKNGVNVNSASGWERSALSYAAGNGHEAVVRLLLENGAKVDSVDLWGRSALSYAAENGHGAVVRLLLENGAKVDSAGFWRQSALSYAAENGHEAVVRLLLDYGAKLAQEFRYGQTPLSAAVKNGNVAVIRILLLYGADVTSNMVLAAAKNGHDAIAGLLDNYGAQTPLYIAVKNGHKVTIRQLLLSGAKVTPMMVLLATENGDNEIIRLLLKFLNTLIYGQLIITLFNCLYSVFFFEWPDGQRVLSTTMPWNIPPSLLVLWGVCWMFVPYGRETCDEAGTSDERMEFRQYQSMNNPENSLAYDSYGVAGIPGAESLASVSNPIFQDWLPGYDDFFTGEYNFGYPELIHPIQAQFSLSQEIPMNDFYHTPWNGNLMGIITSPSEPILASMVQPNSVLQALVTPYPYGDLTINESQGQGTEQLGGYFVSPTPQHLQRLESLSELASYGPSPSSQPSSSQHSSTEPQHAVPPRGVPKHIRQCPVPNEQGQYICTYEGCTNTKRIFRLPCHWQIHMDTHERVHPCLKPSCSTLKGFTSRGGLKRHEKQVHKMHGGVELFCPHADCGRAIGRGRPFMRRENLTDHLRRQHDERAAVPAPINRPIAARVAPRRQRKLLPSEGTEAQSETALLRATVERLTRRLEEVEKERFGRHFSE